MPGPFDVFLSYNSADRDQVEEIAEFLRDEGLSVFFDVWNMVPGEESQKQLEDALDQSKCCVLCLGPSRMGPWQNVEARAALDLRTKKSNSSTLSPPLRILPVLLPGVLRVEESGLPSFLRGFHWVDFREHVREKYALHRLVCGIKGLEPDACRVPMRGEICPFRGLEFFREEDRDFFFGRESEIQRLVHHLERKSLVVLVGPSGSGKSSVIRAGVIPELKERWWGSHVGTSSDAGFVTVMTPEVRPLENLALALRKLHPGLRPSLSGVLQELGSDQRALHFLAREIAQDRNTDKLLLVIDQFEGFFTDADSAESELEQRALDRKTFFDLLVTALDANGPLKVILGMRSDFLGRCSAHPTLNVYVQDHLEQLGAMGDADLARAVERPAMRAGLGFEPHLLSRILQDSSGASGELPNLQHALLELWEGRQGNLLTFAVYEKIGGVQGAIAHRAEVEYEKLDPAARERLRRMFVLRLVQLGDGTENTRKRALKKDLLAAGGEPQGAKQVLEAWVNARLLTSSLEDGKELVDVAHEALIRRWPRVETWLNENRDLKRDAAVIEVRARQWESAGRNPSDLPKGILLQTSKKLLSHPDYTATPLEEDFIQSGIRRRKLKIRLSLAIVCGFVVLVSWFFVSIQAARQESDRLLALQYWSEGRRASSRGDPEGLHWLAEAASVVPKGSLANSILADLDSRPVYPTLLILRHEAEVWGADLGGDGKRLLTCSSDGTARLWDVSTGDQPEPSLQHQGPVRGAVFSPDQKLVITWSDDGTARLWDSATGGKTGLSLQHEGPVRGAAFSPDQELVLTWSDDGTARLWNAATGEPTVGVLRHQDHVRGAAFSSDQRRVLTWSDDGTARLWDTANGQPAAPSLQHQGPVLGSVLSPDLNWVLTCGYDGTAQIWETSSGKRVGSRLQHGGPVRGGAFSADQKLVLTWSFDGTARLWDPSTGEQVVPSLRHDGRVVVAGGLFGPGLNRVLTWSHDKTARLWDIATGQQVGPSLEHEAPVAGAVLTPNPNEVLTWSNDGTARLWDAATGEQRGPSLRHQGPVAGALASPDGDRVVTWSYDKTARLWDVSGGQQKGLMLSHESEKQVHGAVFTSDQKRVLTWGEDRKALFWDALTGQPTGPTLQHAGPVLGALLDADQSRVLTWGADATARLWDAYTGKQLCPSLQHQDTVRGALFSADESRILSWSDDKMARLWNSASGAQIGPSLRHDDRVRGAVFSPEESLVLTWSDDATARLWDASSGTQTCPTLRHGGGVRGAAFSPDGKRVLTWSGDMTARMWNAATGEEILPRLDHQGAVKGAVFSPDQKLVLSWSNNGSVRLWDAFTGVQKIPTLQHQGQVNQALFGPDQKLILTCSHDNTARLWDAATGEPVGPVLRHKSAVIGGIFSADNKRLLTWSFDRTARLWDIATGEQVGINLQHKGPVLGAVFAEDQRRILTWSENAALIWDFSGDLDFPRDQRRLEVQALTGVALNTSARQLEILSSAQFNRIKAEYASIGEAHIGGCRYRNQNCYRRYFRSAKRD